MIELQFAVTGDGDFPTDMLRLDRCFPDSERSSYRLIHSGVRTVVLRTVCRGQDWTPSTEWPTTGWRIEPGSLKVVIQQNGLVNV